jgi:hypothetical protein
MKPTVYISAQQAFIDFRKQQQYSHVKASQKEKAEQEKHK